MTTKTIYPNVTAWLPESVAAFAFGGDDILVLDRVPPQIDVVEILAGRIHEYRASVTRNTVDEHVACGLAELGIECSVLKRDIAELAQSFLVQFQLRTLRLRIEIANIQSCPKFHCDNVNIRLVTTYYGPTTEYQFVGDQLVHTAPLYGLVFLKGHKHQTHRDLVLHRSPEVPAGTKRLCVVIDF